MVREYGVYAKHSGIPEIKTVLGGFVIRRFLGLWTLITKSLGLVSFAFWDSPLRGADSTGSGRGVWHVVGKGGAVGPRCLLLRQLVYQVISQHQQ